MINENSMVVWFALNLGLVLLAYLLGSLPPGYLAGKWLKGIDIRREGSGSTGATNVLRTLGKGPALVVFGIDVLKGSLALWLVNWAYAQAGWLQAASPAMSLENWQNCVGAIACMAALLGHSKSIWLNFQGGKSVATSLGILLAIDWRVALGAVVTFGVVIGVSRIVSISSVCGAIAVMGLMVLLQKPWPFQLFGLVGGIYVIVRHRSNLQRLLAGTEPKLGQKLPEPTSVQ